MMRSDSSDSSGVRAKKPRRRLANSDSSDASSTAEPPPRTVAPPSSDSGSSSDSDASSSVGSLNDGLDADLMGDSQDRERLAQMTEKEREEELFKRAERREAMKARAMVKRKLKKKRRDGGKSAPLSSSPRAPLSSGSSATSDEEDAVGGVGARGQSQRKASLQQSRRHQSRNSQLAALMARRKELAQKSKLKTSDIFSEDDSSSSSPSSEDERPSRQAGRRPRALSSESPNSSEVDEGRQAGSQAWLMRGSPEKRPVKKFYDSSVSSELSEEDEAVEKAREERRRRREEERRDKKKEKRRKERRSSPEHRPSKIFSTSEDEDRRRSDRTSDESEEEREQEEKHVDCLLDLLKLRVSRYRLAKWVHMPFFKDIVIGMFVRVGIGRRPDQNSPVYRIGEVADVVETGKVYDVEKTRTNKGLILRHAGDKAMFRLKFVSNQPFNQVEFARWQHAMSTADLSTPTLSFVAEKAVALRKAHHFRLDSERDLDLILAEKRRFQTRPRNYTMRKLELMKQRDEANMTGDRQRIRQINDEMAEVEREANEIDRRRNAKIKPLTYINQRNREKNLQNAEEACKLEAKDREEMEKVGGDPFTRLKTRPVLLASGEAPPWVKEREQREKRAKAEAAKQKTEEEQRGKERLGRSEEESVVRQGDFYSIHDFDVGVDISMAGEDTSLGSGGQAALVSVPVPAGESAGPSLKPKTLNLEEYKRRRNLL